MDMRDVLVDWDDADDEDGNTAHINEHGLSPDEVETALVDEDTTFDVSESSDRPIAFGTTNTGRYIAIVFDVSSPSDPFIVRPITEYEVPQPSE
jgi:uncharacterized DUF497 family protein